MSQVISTTIERDTATPAIRHVLETAKPERLNEIVGHPCVELTRRHLGAYKNRRGFPSTGFGEAAADETFWAPTPDGPKVVINKVGARFRYLGGTLRPVNKRFLCFGITEESYGKTVYDFGFRPGVRDKALNKRLRALFAFATKLTQQPSPDFIPSRDEYADTAIRAIDSAIKGGAA